MDQRDGAEPRADRRQLGRADVRLRQHPAIRRRVVQTAAPCERPALPHRGRPVAAGGARRSISPHRRARRPGGHAGQARLGAGGRALRAHRALRHGDQRAVLLERRRQLGPQPRGRHPQPLQRVRRAGQPGATARRCASPLPMPPASPTAGRKPRIRQGRPLRRRAARPGLPQPHKRGRRPRRRRRRERQPRLPVRLFGQRGDRAERVAEPAPGAARQPATAVRERSRPGRRRRHRARRRGGPGRRSGQRRRAVRDRAGRRHDRSRWAWTGSAATASTRSSAPRW